MPSCNVHLQNRVFRQKHRLLWELLLPNIVCMSQSVQVLRFLCLSYRCQVGDLQDVPLPRQGQHFDLISLPRKPDSLVAWLTFFSHKEQRSKTGECGNHWCCWFSPDASTWPDAKACRLAKPAKPQLWQVLATLRHRSNLPQAIADYSSPRSLTLTVLHSELLLSLVWRTKWHGVCKQWQSVPHPSAERPTSYQCIDNVPSARFASLVRHRHLMWAYPTSLQVPAWHSKRQSQDMPRHSGAGPVVAWYS